jgi:TolB-like protein/Tfp pilus assembly protein PilF
MQIWSTEIKELEILYTSIKGHFPELEKELERLVKADDENMILLYSRRCLEVIITDLCEYELKRPRKTEPLKGIIDKLHREEKVPSHIITSMESLNSLSTYGTHPKEFDPEQVRPILLNLATIIKWYVKYKDTQTIGQANLGEAKYENKEPIDTRESIHKPNKRLILLLSGIIVVIAIIITVLLLFNIIGGSKQTKELEKSIAVLPFENLSSDEEQTWFSDGITDVIISQLSKISDLRVLGRTSTLKYKEQEEKKSITEIGEELGVNFIIEGTVQRQGNKMRISVQLIRTINEDHLWSEIYDREYQDIFIIQSEIAQLIANELKAIVTPEEKQLIEKTPTTSLTAYDFFQRGREEYWKYWSDNDNREALERAEDLYHEALRYDSTFAQAYTGLAWIYWDKHYWETFFSESFMDSVMILTDIALSNDDQLSEAYTIRGRYYYQMGKPEKAIEEYDKAIKLNPNDWIAYSEKGGLYSNYDLVKSIDSYNKAISLNRGEQLPELLRELSYQYLEAGLLEYYKNYLQKAFKLKGDSLDYYTCFECIEYHHSNFATAIEYNKKRFTADSSNADILFYSGKYCSYIGQYKEALKYYKKALENSKSLSYEKIFSLYLVGWAYWQNGYKEEAEYYFNKQIDYCNKLNELGRVLGDPYHKFYDLAAVYAFRGERDKAYNYLRIFNKRQMVQQSWVIEINNNPLFNSIRNEPEFQQIVRDVEAKYQAEHERVRKWLEEQERL